MSTLVFLDTGPLGMVTNPHATPQTERCTDWLEGLLTRGVRVLIPEIADHELRREILRAEKIEGLRRLDADVILAAQVVLAATVNDAGIVATENVGHLARFVPA